MAALMHAIEDAPGVYRAWRDRLADAPDEITGACVLWWMPETPALPEEVWNRHVVIPAAVY